MSRYELTYFGLGTELDQQRVEKKLTEQGETSDATTKTTARMVSVTMLSTVNFCLLSNLLRVLP